MLHLFIEYIALIGIILFLVMFVREYLGMLDLEEEKLRIRYDGDSEF